MRATSVKNQIELNNAAIGSAVETATASLKEAGVARRTILRTSLLLSVLVYLGLSNIDPDLAVKINDAVVTPCASMLMGVLHAITGPLICVSLISGICALGDMATFKGTGIRAKNRNSNETHCVEFQNLSPK